MSEENNHMELRIGNSNSFDNIILSGGSLKCISMLGALQYLWEQKYLKDVKVFVGTSAGAIISYLLSINYTPLEIITYICTHQICQKFPFFNLVNMINGEGATTYSYIQEHLEKLTIEKIGSFMTMKKLQDNFGKRLICVTYNQTKCKTEYITPETHPDLPCITALKMSSSLPLVFPRFLYNGCYYVDGGIADNFPITLLDHDKEKSLGILVSTESEEQSVDEEFKLLDYIYSLIIVPISLRAKEHIEIIHPNCRVLQLRAPKLKSFDFNHDTKFILDLFGCGYKSAKDFFNDGI